MQICLQVLSVNRYLVVPINTITFYLYVDKAKSTNNIKQVP